VRDDRLYDAIGGAAALDLAVTIFYDRVLADPAVVPWFDGVDLPHLRQHQRDFMTIVLGGPTHVGTASRYQGRGLAVAHAGRGITDDAFTRVRDHFVGTLGDLGAPPERLDEVRERVESYRSQVVGQEPT
jgi:hemoglobin